MKIFFHVAIAFLMLGCATKNYTPPLSSEPTARLRVVTTFFSHTWVHTLNESCYRGPNSDNLVAPLPIGPGLPPRRYSIGMPEFSPSENARFVEFVIPAGKEFGVGIYSEILSVCRIAIGFVPEKGADYEISHFGEGNKCRVEVNKIVSFKNKQTGLSGVQSVRQLPRC